MPDTAALRAPTYQEDFYAWALDQAARLQRLAAERADLPLDLINLADEVEALALSARSLCRSQVRRIVEHLLKLEFSPGSDARHQWELSIVDARQELEDNLSASLEGELGKNLAKLYAEARKRAVLALRTDGEGEAAKQLPETCPYSLENILDPDWCPTR